MADADRAVARSCRDVSVAEWRAGVLSDRSDRVAEEVPVALVYNGISHAVMMASPADLEEFALGFSFTEGIIDSPSDIYGIECAASDLGMEVEIEVSSRQFQRLKQRRRQLAGRTGCGICGAESLEQLRVDPAPVQGLDLSHRSVQRAVANLSDHQPLQALTGGVHGAAWCDRDGRIDCLREDVGRHNALDKLIGYRLLRGSADEGFALVSSRASYEMVQKAARAGMGALVSVSAATGMAVEMARRSGMTLIGFARRSRHVVYVNRGMVGGGVPDCPDEGGV